jgi:8-hydroxy-5-deazaflavin:NADPH oxidoreductase
VSQKVLIIGSGKVGGSLRQGLERTIYEVRVGVRDELAKGAAWADLIVLAVPHAAVQDVAHELGAAADRKIVVDVTNALGPDMQLAIGFSTSAAEELQRALPLARVVKAFNTVFAQHMGGGGSVSGQQLSVFGAGDDAGARETVLELGKALGFAAVDAGPLKNARHLEALAALNIQLGFVVGYGPNSGFKYVH